MLKWLKHSQILKKSGMFKEKISKKKSILQETSLNESSTLDEKHKHMIQTIQNHLEKKDILHQWYHECSNQLSVWKDRIQDLYQDQQIHSPEYQEAWDSNLYYSDRLRYIQQEIKQLNNETKEVEYYENTGSILFHYYELIDQQEQPSISSSLSHLNKQSSKHRKKIVSIPQRSILDAFQGVFLEEPIKPIESTATEDEQVVNRDKLSLVHDYLLAMDQAYLKHVPDAIINHCSRCQIPLNCLAQEGMMVCPTCGYQELLLVEQNRPIYRSSNKEASHYTYKRINHFNEWISQIQAKESTDIPEEIFEQIVSEIKKEKIKDLTKLSYNKMRAILKKLQRNKYYEHIYYIIYRLNGIPAPNFSPELEEKLRNMFKEIQSPFLKYCPPTRKNFLSYSYVLYKFCQLLERDEYLKYFTLLKSREKLHLQDQIWKKICEDVHWEFIQSI